MFGIVIKNYLRSNHPIASIIQSKKTKENRMGGSWELIG